MDLGAMQQQMMANPAMMQAAMESPAMQNLLDDPEMMRSMMQSNPQRACARAPTVELCRCHPHVSTL
jgi:hypothetical protein